MRQVMGQIMRRFVRCTTPLRFAVAAGVVLLALAPARGQGFPDQPIRVIVPTQAGGMADILSRVFAQKVKERSGATVIVENKTGTPEALGAHVDAEYKKWGDVVRKANITLPQ